MLAKIENEQLQPVPRSYMHNGISYSNYDMLPEYVLKSHGWKPFTETEPPPAKDGIGYNPVYVDNGTEITIEWREYELPPQEEDVEDQEIRDMREALAIIFGEDASKTAETNDINII